jgi:diguanylate cyclase (GGDEF)-like protein/PAS domain S-box-containing protein
MVIPPLPQPTSLLEAAYAVSRFLLHERDLANLLQGICDRLTGQGAARAVLLVLHDRDSGGVITAETGLGNGCASLMDGLRQGQLPRCGTEALQGAEGTTVLCSACDCGLCNAGDGNSAAIGLTVSLRCTSSLVGFLILRLPPAVRPTDAERALIAELAESISLTLQQLFADEAAKQRTQELERIEERYELALHASQAGLWDWNIRTGEMYTSPDQWELLDYRAEGADPTKPHRFIHPDDREQVLAVLNEHLSGKTEEYRIEYRVQEKNGEWTWFLDRGRVVERDENNMPVRMTGTHQNITLQKRQDQAIALVQQQLHDAVNYERNFLQTVIDSAGDPVMVIDLSYNLLLINQAASRLVRTGEDIQSLQGQKCYRLFCGAEQPCQDLRFPCPVAQVKTDGRQAKLIHNPYHGNGVNNTFELEVSPLRDTRGELYGIIEVARDITDRLRIEKELRESQSHLYRLAHHDTLTGLPNRLLFRDRFSQAISKAERNRTGVAVLFLDLDRFKSINDTLGHDVGDALLVEVAARLQRQCRQSDTVARLGGDEFVFILEAINTRKDAGVVAAKIMTALGVPVLAKGHEIAITTSIGIALFPLDATTSDEVIKCADLALYTAKEIGRSNYQFYRQDIPLSGSRPRLDEPQFRRAMETGELRIHYLPRYDLDSGQVTGLKAQLRWHHPAMGLLLPETVIQSAEECGVLGAMNGWLVTEVCGHHEAWMAHGSHCPPVTIPLEPQQILENGFLAMLEELVQQQRLPPQGLVLEVREQTIIEATAQTLESLAQIRRFGLRLAISDFGTDRTSLSRLQRLPLSCVTLGRELLVDLPQDTTTATLVAALIGLGHSLGLQMVADGVEQEAQREFLRHHGCDQVQGPLLSAPLHPEKIPPLLQTLQKGG